MQRYIHTAMLFAAIGLVGCSPFSHFKRHEQLEKLVAELDAELAAQKVQNDALVNNIRNEGKLYPQLSAEPSFIVRTVIVEGQMHEVEIDVWQYFTNRLLNHNPTNTADYARFVE